MGTLCPPEPHSPDGSDSHSKFSEEKPRPQIPCQAGAPGSGVGMHRGRLAWVYYRGKNAKWHSVNTFQKSRLLLVLLDVYHHVLS